MELEDHEEQMDSFEVSFKQQRNVFLIVLCCLTLFMCAIELFLAVASMFSTTNYFGVLAKSNGSSIYLLTSFVAPLFCATGAVLMLFKQKMGFWIYAITQGTLVVYSIYNMLSLTNNLSSGLFFGLLVNSIQIAFIVGYAMQFRNKKNKRVDLNF